MSLSPNKILIKPVKFVKFTVENALKQSDANISVFKREKAYILALAIIWYTN